MSRIYRAFRGQSSEFGSIDRGKSSSSRIAVEATANFYVFRLSSAMFRRSLSSKQRIGVQLVLLAALPALFPLP